MQDDEQAIRELFVEWQSATEAGDTSRLHHLMSDDVMFLTCGREPICGKEAFLAIFRDGLRRFRISPYGEIREVQVDSDFAYCRAYLSVTVTPFHGGLPIRRAGDTLTILRKQQDGMWVITRDANMLTPQPLGPM